MSKGLTIAPGPSPILTPTLERPAGAVSPPALIVPPAVLNPTTFDKPVDPSRLAALQTPGTSLQTELTPARITQEHQIWGLPEPKAAAPPTVPPAEANPLAGRTRLGHGAKGEQLQKLQEQLRADGIPFKAETVFGAETEKAVRAYQAKHGLKVDGIVGQQTWGAFAGKKYPPGTNLLRNHPHPAAAHAQHARRTPPSAPPGGPPSHHPPAGAKPSVVPSTTAAASPAPGTADDLGGLSEKYESTGPGDVSRTKGDAGGASYGIYQVSANTGSAQKFVDSLKSTRPDLYAKLSAHPVGSRAFDADWKAVAHSDPRGFRAAQQGFEREHFYEPGVRNIKNATGLDLSQRSAALNEVVWSTVVQHGPGPGHGGADAIVKAALHGRDPASVSDADLIRGIYAERGRKSSDGGLVHFHSSSASVQASVARRYRSEEQDALGLLPH